MTYPLIIEELRPDPITRPGDIWALGDHRLICGDATDPAVVARLAVLAGAIDLPGYATDRRAYLACDWLPTKWDWIDPAKDASAEILQIEAGLKSRTQAIAERGYDAEQVDREIAAERKREAELGLDFRRPASPAQAAGGGAGQGADGQQENQPDSGNAAEDDEDRQPRPAEEGCPRPSAPGSRASLRISASSSPKPLPKVAGGASTHCRRWAPRPPSSAAKRRSSPVSPTRWAIRSPPSALSPPHPAAHPPPKERA